MSGGGGFVVRRGRTILVVIALLTVGMGFAATNLTFSTSPETLLDTGDPEVEGLRAHEEIFGTFEHRVLLLMTGDAFDPETLSRLRRATSDLDDLPLTAGVRSIVRTGFPLPDPSDDGFRAAVLRNRLVTPFLVSEDGATFAIAVNLRPDADTARTRGATIETLVETVEDAGLSPMVAGVPAVRDAYARFIEKSLLMLPPLVSAVLAVLLLGAFRAVVPVLALLAVVGLAAVWTVGTVGLTGGRITALTSILPSLILVVGIAAGVHVVAQFREERLAGKTPRDAAGAAIRRMTLPCGLTAVTTAVGFSALALADIRDLREFGIYSAVGTIYSFVLGVPLVGILLSMTKDRPPARRGEALMVGFLRRLSDRLVRTPSVGIAAGLVMVAFAAAGIPRLTSDSYMLEDIREGEPIHVAVSTADRELGGLIGFDLLLSAPGDRLFDAESTAAIRRLESRMAEVDGVRAVVGPGTLLSESARAAGLDPASVPAAAVLGAIRAMGGERVVDSFVAPGGRLARVIVTTGDIGSNAVRRVRREVVALARETMPEAVAVRAGGLALAADSLLSRLLRDLAESTVIAFVVITVLMVGLYGVRIGLLSMIPNFLPLAVAAGFMGFAAITLRSSIALIFAVSLGIAVDDTIHILTRYRRERKAGAHREEAVRRSILWTGRPVLLTSIVLFVGFLVFLSASFKATQQFGLITATTIAAAWIGDTLLLPVLLLGFDRKGGE